jgi:hypothetical protein
MPSSGPYYDYSTPGDVRKHGTGGSGGRRKSPIRRGRPPKGSNLEELRNFWNNNYSGEFGASEEGLALADAFMAMFGNGYTSGGVGGIDRQRDGNVINEYGEFSGGGFNQGSPISNEWLGRDSKVYDRFGDPIRFRRDVSPYMMYNYAEMPEMWDELPDPATPSRGEAGMSEAFMADPYREEYTRQYNQDRYQDFLEIADKERRRTGDSGLSNILAYQQNRLDAIRRRHRSGG